MNRVRWILAAAVCLSPSGARADLRDTANVVLEGWRAAGAKVSLADAHFLFDRERITVGLPPAEEEASCVAIALIAPRGMSFRARVVEAHEDEEPTPMQSAAGVLELARCGEPLEQIQVESEAGRGVVEVVVGRASSPLPALAKVLPERTGGLVPKAAEPGVLPPVAPIARRLEAAMLRAKLDGAKTTTRKQVGSDARGGGTLEVVLPAGCHRLDVMPAASNAIGKRRVDVDAELRTEDGDMLARDRSDTPDARLEACVGEDKSARIVWSGAPRGTDVIAVHASWPIPEGLPMSWGPDARARMARALMARHQSRSFERKPVHLAMGMVGRTSLALDVEPGGCYTVIAAVSQGFSRGIGIHAYVGSMESSDERTSTDEWGLVAFCAREHTRARIEIDARGSGVAWGLAAYLQASRVWRPAP